MNKSNGRFIAFFLSDNSPYVNFVHPQRGEFEQNYQPFGKAIILRIRYVHGVGTKKCQRISKTKFSSRERSLFVVIL